MKILFFTDSHEDYVSDSLLHGLKKLFGDQVVDYPRKDILYQSGNSANRGQMWGKGFTLYGGLLQEDQTDRYDIAQRIQNSFFDLVLLSSIHRQDHFFRKYQPWLHKRNTLIIDGEDGCRPIWENDRSLSVLKRYRYYKREQKKPAFRLFSRPAPLRPISISYPEEKIHTISEKTKQFCSHIVDPEVAAQLQADTQHLFSKEADYYRDLQTSRFGITIKKGGWDCLRHYEMAGNGAVLCFRNLDHKPAGCAPHGLSHTNTINYASARDLIRKTDNLKPDEYESLRVASLRWIRANTTVKCAERILADFRNGQ